MQLRRAQTESLDNVRLHPDAGETQESTQRDSLAVLQAGVDARLALMAVSAIGRIQIFVFRGQQGHLVGRKLCCAQP